MVSYMKKSLGLGNTDPLPPAEYLAESPYKESEDQDDCTGCTDPCEEHKEYPSYLKIDTDRPLAGSVKPYGRHVLIATGTSDWPKKIEEAEDTFASSLSDIIHSSKSTTQWKNLITNSSLISTYSTVPDSCDVMILPDNIIVSNVTSDKAEIFNDIFLASDLPTESMDIEKTMKDEQRLGDMKIQKNPFKTMLLLCSHMKRDKRCGITAPILAQEFDHVLREKDLSEHDAMVIMVSHIGGHKIAGNVICYTNEGTRGVWYGRVKTCHCRAIVEETIINGKVIKEIYRGSMDNSFGANQATTTKRSFLSW